MSNESYRILNNAEANKYIDCPWFQKECRYIQSYGWAVPEKYLFKDIDTKKFWNNKLQELLDEFDFTKVHNIMDLLDWHWAGVIGVPEENDMIELVKGLYKGIEKSIIAGVYSYSATGGFKLSFNPDEDNELSLIFEAVSYAVYDDRGE